MSWVVLCKQTLVKTQSCAIWNPSCHFMQSYSIARGSLIVPGIAAALCRSLCPGGSALIPGQNSSGSAASSCQTLLKGRAVLLPSLAHKPRTRSCWRWAHTWGELHSPAALCWWVRWDQQLGKLGEHSVSWNRARVTVLNGSVKLHVDRELFLILWLRSTVVQVYITKWKKIRGFSFSVSDDMSQFSMKLS